MSTTSPVQGTSITKTSPNTTTTHSDSSKEEPVPEVVVASKICEVGLGRNLTLQKLAHTFAEKCWTVVGGLGIHGMECIFPFTHLGITHTACTRHAIETTEQDLPWCSTKVTADGVHLIGEWGVCGHEYECPFEKGNH